MHIEPSGALLIAVAIFAHAWVSRLQGPPAVVNVVAWVVVTVTVLVFVFARS